jgi:ribose/xylose/arabinose/galactoside ABC-type transport system permease subunit
MENKLKSNKIAELIRNNSNEAGVGIALIVLFLVFSITSPYFLQTNNLNNVLYQVSAIGILAIAQTMVLLTGGIDLSIGSIFTLSGWLMCFFVKEVGLAQGIAIGLAVGILCGLINGFLISVTRLEPFIVTLGTMSIFHGIVYIISDSKAVSNLPVILEKIDNFKLLGIPSYVLTLLIVFVLSHFFLTYTKTGRMIYAIGSNELSARYSGVPVHLYKMVPYVLVGFLSFIAVFLQSAHLMAIDANAGTNLNLDSITAVVIGGTSLQGGRGSLIGTAIGVLLIGILGNGLNMLGVSSYWQRVVVGIILIFAIASQKIRLANKSKVKAGQENQ